MTIKILTNDRRALVRAISEHLGTDAAYVGPPSFAYKVGPITIGRYCDITAENDADLETLKPALIERGFTIAPDGEPAEEPVAATIETTDTVSAEAHANANEEEHATADAPDVDFEESADGIGYIEIKRTFTDMDAAQISNLLRSLRVRQKLINAMVQGDCLAISDDLIAALDEEQPEEIDRIAELVRQHNTSGIRFENSTVVFTFPNAIEKATTFSVLMTLILERAKEAKRVNATVIDPEETEMKYFCNSYLVQLGMRGGDYKDVRYDLLNHLKGYAAFRTADKMAAHKAKFAERRRQRREEARVDSEAAAQSSGDNAAANDAASDATEEQEVAE